LKWNLFVAILIAHGTQQCRQKFVESGNGVLGKGQRAPCPAAREFWGAVSFPNRVRGKAPTTSAFWMQ